jgi:hypothetical protein
MRAERLTLPSARENLCGDGHRDPFLSHASGAYADAPIRSHAKAALSKNM